MHQRLWPLQMPLRQIWNKWYVNSVLNCVLVLISYRQTEADEFVNSFEDVDDYKLVVESVAKTKVLFYPVSTIY